MNQQLSPGATAQRPANPAENYERFFVPTIGRPVADDLIEVAAPKTGERVLDVGCGTGVVARLAAPLVGATGAVAGVDINPAMLEVARAIDSGTPRIDWYEASAESIPLPDASFDLVLCQMVLQFVPDKLAALREMHRVLAPGGRLALNVPGPIPEYFADLATVLQSEISPEAAGFARTVFAMGDPGELKQLTTDAGFKNVDAHTGPKQLKTPPPREFMWQYIQSTPLAPHVMASPEERRKALETDIASKWQRYAANGGMTLDVGMITVTAEK